MGADDQKTAGRQAFEGFIQSRCCNLISIIGQEIISEEKDAGFMGRGGIGQEVVNFPPNPLL